MARERFKNRAISVPGQDAERTTVVAGDNTILRQIFNRQCYNFLQVVYED